MQRQIIASSCTYGQSYRRTHPLPVSHLKVIEAVEHCRTAALGGHIQRCDSCGFERSAYNSCRNRHCPKCQALGLKSGGVGSQAPASGSGT